MNLQIIKISIMAGWDPSMEDICDVEYEDMFYYLNPKELI